MTFLDTPVCKCCGGNNKTTIGDVFKLIIPVAWSTVAFMACLAYLISPLSRGDTPRWGSAALVALSGAAGTGLSIAIYSFHRTTSSFAIEENYVESSNDGDGEREQDEDQQGTTKLEPPMKKIQRQKMLQIHAVLALGLSILSIILAIFFGVFASNLNKCAHETCGADVSWSCITLVVSVLWMGITYLGFKHLRQQLLPEKDATNNENDQGLEIP